MTFICVVCHKEAEETFVIRYDFQTGKAEGICSEDCFNKDLAYQYGLKEENDGHES